MSNPIELGGSSAYTQAEAREEVVETPRAETRTYISEEPGRIVSSTIPGPPTEYQPRPLIPSTQLPSATSTTTTSSSSSFTDAEDRTSDRQTPNGSNGNMPSKVTFQNPEQHDSPPSNGSHGNLNSTAVTSGDMTRARSSSIATFNSSYTDDTSMTSNGVDCVPDKRIKEWKKKFDVEPGEELICTHGCALVIEIMIHGRLFLTNKNVYFRANIVGKVTKRKFPISSIMSLAPRNVAGVIPNAIEILHSSPSSPSSTASETEPQKSLFTTLPKRDHVLANLITLWRKANPERYESFIRGEGAALDGFETQGGKRSRSASIVSGGVLNREDDDADSIDSASSSASTTKDHPIVGGKGEGATVGGKEPDKDGQKGGGSTGGDGSKKGPHPATKADTPDLEKQALHTRLPSEPQKCFELLYQNQEFLKSIWQGEGFSNINMHEWENRKRYFTYSRPLGGKYGSTRCESHEELVHPEGNQDWWGVEGTTQTPGVPAGKSFLTRSKTVFTYAEGGGTVMHVTYQVEWTGRSMLKSMINGQAESGQQTWNALLAKKMREYIKQHPDEFPSTGNDEGIDEEEEEEAAAVKSEPGSTGTKSSASATTSHSRSASSSSDSGDFDPIGWLSEDPIRAVMAGLLALIFLSLIYSRLKILFFGEMVTISKKRLLQLEAIELAQNGLKGVGKAVGKASSKVTTTSAAITTKTLVARKP